MLAVIEGVPFEALIGPYALLVAALIAVGVLWRAHAKEDERKERIIDRQGDVIDGFTPAIKDLTDVIKDVIEDRDDRPPARRPRT